MITPMPLVLITTSAEIKAQHHALVIQAIAARVAYGLFGAEFMAADPTDALLFLLRRICERKGAGLNYANRADQKDHGASGGHTR